MQPHFNAYKPGKFGGLVFLNVFELFAKCIRPKCICLKLRTAKVHPNFNA